jgi:hypothetical protein
MDGRAKRTKASKFSLDGLKEAREGVSRLDQLDVSFSIFDHHF